MATWLGGLIRYGGVFSIIIFSATSIFFSFIERTIPEDRAIKSYISYAPFVENKFYDLRMPKDNVGASQQLNKDIILLKIDDESLREIGSWPLNRLTWAKMLNRLEEFGAKVVAFDIFFPEKARVCGVEDPDQSFADAIRSFQSIEGNQVIFPYIVQPEGAYTHLYQDMPESLYDFTLTSEQADEENSLEVKKVEQNTFTIQTLLDASPALAYINMLEDGDGLFRHYQVVANVDGLIILPSMALKAFESYTGQTTKISIDRTGSATLEINDKEIFVNNKGESKIRWFGSNDAFQEVSIADVVREKYDKEELTKIFKNKAVFVGSTATGAHDLRNTPIDAKLPGVYAHINMLYMLLNQHFYQDLSESIKISYMMLGIATLLLIIVMLFNSAFADLATTVILCASCYYIDQSMLIENGYEIRLFFIFFTIITTYTWITLLNFNQANDDKKRIKGAFSKYVAPSIVNDMLANPDKLSVGGERRDITCMFSDVRDFTSISEKLSATELSGALNKYMGAMTEIVFNTNGTLDKYIGDAIVAFWGAPIDIGDHVTQAVQGAIEMMEKLPEINADFKNRGLPEFKVGIGLNSGECNVGNMGSDQIFAYTALGDTMNLGARLESSCKFYGAQILISEYTYERLNKDDFTIRLIDNVQVKGKTQPVKVYEVLYSGHSMFNDNESLKTFARGYKEFTDKNFEAAISTLNQVLEKYPEDKSSIRLIQTSKDLIENPPKSDEDHTITVRTDK